MEMLKWVGPGIVWMVSALGTGELLFTPRMAALYGYSLLWAMILAVLFKLIISREIGRYTIVTGLSILEGFRRLPGPKNWAVWLIVVPQIFVAFTTITGMAGITGSVLIVKVAGSIVLWAIVFLALSIALVLWGKYKGVERVSMIMSAIIALALVIASFSVFPGWTALGSSLVPTWRQDYNVSEILPWIGFVQAGAAGLMWFSYWLMARDYGVTAKTESENGEADQPLIDPAKLSDADKSRMHQWLKVMTVTLFLSILLTIIILLALLVLGAELLQPRGIVPEGPQVARELSRLLGSVWGGFGTWLFLVAAFLSFWSTIITDQDGWARMLGQGSVFIGRQFNAGGKWVSRRFYKYLLVLGLMGLLPAIAFWIKPEPVFWLSFAGIVEAIHIPVMTAAVIYLNVKELPEGLKPSGFINAAMGLVALFFLFFAGFYLYNQFTGQPSDSRQNNPEQSVLPEGHLHLLA